MILVARLSQNLPFGYRFVLIAPIVEGLLGGTSLPSGINSTYHNRVFRNSLWWGRWTCLYRRLHQPLNPLQIPLPLHGIPLCWDCSWSHHWWYSHFSDRRPTECVLSGRIDSRCLPGRGALRCAGVPLKRRNGEQSRGSCREEQARTGAGTEGWQRNLVFVLDGHQESILLP